MGYDIRLLDTGTNTIATLRALRTAFHPMTLFEAKNVTDNVPVTIASNVSSEKADELAKALSGVARIEVRVSTSVGQRGLPVASIILPDAGPKWIKLADFKLGEFVTADSKAEIDDIRIITEKGAITLDGLLVSVTGDDVYYQRFPVGTVLKITV